VFEKDIKQRKSPISNLMRLFHDLLLIPVLFLYCALMIIGIWFNNRRSLKIILGVESIFIFLLLIEWAVYLLCNVGTIYF